MDKASGRYDIATDEILFAAGVKFDVSAVAAAHAPWWNRTLAQVNDAWVRLGVLDGDFHWHRHDGGQLLLVTYGEGKVRAEAGDEHRIGPGDTVWISPGERHWHGAGETTCMAHVAISLGGHDWLEPVTDEEYGG